MLNISTLFLRSKEICNLDCKKEEDHRIRKALKENYYPTIVINKCYKKINNNNLQERNKQKNNQPQKFISGQCIRGASERILRILRPHGLILAHKPSTT